MRLVWNRTNGGATKIGTPMRLLASRVTLFNQAGRATKATATLGARPRNWSYVASRSKLPDICPEKFAVAFLAWPT